MTRRVVVPSVSQRSRSAWRSSARVLPRASNQASSARAWRIWVRARRDRGLGHRVLLGSAGASASSGPGFASRCAAGGSGGASQRDRGAADQAEMDRLLRQQGVQ
jgi:hypothetical protein